MEPSKDILARAQQRSNDRKIVSNSQNNYQNHLVTHNSIQSDRQLAIAWAKSTGLVHIPNKPHEFSPMLCLVLAFFLVFIGGVIYWLWCKNQKDSYNESISEAVAAWRANGSPNPYQHMTGTSQIPVTQELNTTSQSLTDKLNELAQLRKSGVLTEEEFQSAKKKELNL